MLDIIIHIFTLTIVQVDIEPSMKIKHKESVMTLMVAGTPPMLITGCQDHCIYVYDLQYFQCRYTLKGTYCQLGLPVFNFVQGYNLEWIMLTLHLANSSLQIFISKLCRA